MKKLISKLGFSLVVGSSLLTFSGVAAQGCNPCNNLWDWCKFDGCWELGAAAVYQQHCVQNFTFASLQQGQGPGAARLRPYDVKPKFFWGFKVWGAWYSCDGCDFASLTWKHVWSHKNNRTVNNTSADQLAVIEIPSFFDARRTQATMRTQYDTAYLRAGRNLHCGCDSRFYAFGGIRYVGAELRRQVKARLGTGGGLLNGVKVSDRTYFRGGGVELGVGGEYGLGCGFNIVGQFATLALLGSRNDTAEVLNPNPGQAAALSLKLPDRYVTKCVPGVDFRLGINYTYDWCACGCNLRIVGELGWEMDYYWNMLAARTYRIVFGNLANAGESLVSTVPTNFGTNGPYASLAIRF